MNESNRTRFRPVRPRDAASLVVLRGRGRDTEVLLGRRAARHRFAPRRFVFPGGRVDAGDRRREISGHLRADVARRLRAKWPSSLVHGLAVAAVRECYEETGLRFGELRDGELVPDLSRLDYIVRAITPPQFPIRFHARFFVVEATGGEGTLRSSTELELVRWFPLAQALDLGLIDITEFVVRHVRRIRGGWTPPGTPMFTYRNRKAIVRYE